MELVIEACEFREVRPGLASLFRLVAEDDLEIGSPNLDFLAEGNAKASGGSGKRYSPVLGSASGAASVTVGRGRDVVPTKSLPESLSLSTTEKLRV